MIARDAAEGIMRRVSTFTPMVALLLGFSAGACGGESVPTAPSETTAPPSAVLRVDALQPSVSFGGLSVRLTGTGFTAGTNVAFGSLIARSVVSSSTLISVSAPTGGAGTVDVVVTNPDGQSARVPGGFTYNTVTLAPNRTVVARGSELFVAWTAAHTRCSLDWIGLYELGATNENYGPWDYTACGTGGTVRLIAPSNAGSVEVRYLVDDGYVDVARSVTITVE